MTTLKEYQLPVRDSSHFDAQRDVFISNESKQQFVSVRIVPPEIRTGYTLEMDEISIWKFVNLVQMWVVKQGSPKLKHE